MIEPWVAKLVEDLLANGFGPHTVVAVVPPRRYRTAIATRETGETNARPDTTK